MSCNVVILTGNLTRDPEIRSVNMSGKSTQVANFGIAVNRTFKKEGEKTEMTEFIDCEAWDTGASLMEKLLKKGDKVLIQGSLRQDRWEKDGQKFSRLKVRVTEFEKLTWKDRAEAPADNSQPDEATAKATEGAGEDIPF